MAEVGDERVLNKGSVESCRIRWSWLTQLAYYNLVQGRTVGSDVSLGLGLEL